MSIFVLENYIMPRVGKVDLYKAKLNAIFHGWGDLYI